jgi:hypothetical protein
MVTLHIFIFYTTDIDIMADLPDNVSVAAAAADAEKVPVIHQVGKMTRLDFLLYAIGFTINLQHGILFKRVWSSAKNSVTLLTRTSRTWRMGFSSIHCSKQSYDIWSWLYQ